MGSIGDGGRRPLYFAPPPSPREGASIGEAIYEAFVVKGSRGQRFVIGRVGALVGSILGIGISISVLAHGSFDGGHVGALVAAVIALVAGQVLLRRSAPPMAVLDGGLVMADVLLAITGAQGGSFVVLLPAIYVALGTGVFLIRPLRSAIWHLAGLGMSYGVVLVVGPDTPAALTRWVSVLSAVLISGLFVRWLVGRVIDLATADHAARTEVEESTRELERQSEAKTLFLARMSHELRTPLNVVVGFTDVLRDGLVGPLTERQLSHVEDIGASGRDLLALVDELLDVSKVEGGSLELSLSRVDIGEAIIDAEVLVEGRAREAGVTIAVVRPTEPVLADADALRIRQVAWNLLGNAVKYSPRGSTVHVTVEADERRVRVRVRDQGPGIDPTDQDRIFQQFVQGRGSGEGSGIGLALCRRFIEAHGGRLGLESAPGRGSTFSFEVPRQRIRTRPDEPEEQLAPEPGAWTELDQAILVPGSRASKIAIVEVGRWFSGSAGVLLPTLAILTPGPVGTRLAVGGVALLSLAISQVFGRSSHGLPTQAVDMLAIVGNLGISAAVLFGEPYGDLIALAYGWNVLSSSALLRPARVIAQTALVLVCYAGVLLVSDPPHPLDRWLAIAMVVTTNVVVVGWVAGRLREAITEALGARLAAEATRSQVEAVSAHKSDFLANTSHELCTPLNAIIGFAQVLRDPHTGALEPKQAEYVDDILESGQHLLALITDLLDLAKLEARRLPRSPHAASVTALVHNALGELEPVAARRGIRLVLDAPDAELPAVEADTGHLHHALANVVANAIKFTSDGGRVELMVRVNEHEVLVSVRDNGIGILPNQRPHLFEAFHQGTRPLPEHARGGTGLGLTLAKGLVELEGGTISVESTPDVGSTFTIALPIHAIAPVVAPTGA